MDIMVFAKKIIAIQEEKDKLENGIKEMILELDKNIKIASEDKLSREHLVLVGIQTTLIKLISIWVPKSTLFICSNNNKTIDKIIIIVYYSKYQIHIFWGRLFYMNEKSLAELTELINKLEDDKKDFIEQLQEKREYVAGKIMKGDVDTLLHLDRYSEYSNMLRIAESIKEIETKLRVLEYVCRWN